VISRGSWCHFPVCALVRFIAKLQAPWGTCAVTTGYLVPGYRLFAWHPGIVMFSQAVCGALWVCPSKPGTRACSCCLQPENLYRVQQCDLLPGRYLATGPCPDPMGPGGGWGFGFGGIWRHCGCLIRRMSQQAIDLALPVNTFYRLYRQEFGTD